MRMVEITKKYVGAPYKLGGQSIEEGLDCFSLILAITEDLGYEVPNEFGGYTRETYPELYTCDPVKARKIMLKFISSICDKINPCLIRPKDLVILHNNETGNTFLGMFSGSNMVLTAPETGVGLFDLSLYNVRGVFRYV